MRLFVTKNISHQWPRHIPQILWTPLSITKLTSNQPAIVRQDYFFQKQSSWMWTHNNISQGLTNQLWVKWKTQITFQLASVIVFFLFWFGFDKLNEIEVFIFSTNLAFLTSKSFEKFKQNKLPSVNMWMLASTPRSRTQQRKPHVTSQNTNSYSPSQSAKRKKMTNRYWQTSAQSKRN